MNPRVIVLPVIPKPVPVAPLSANSFPYEFEDLGIDIEGDGFLYGRFDGSAEISYLVDDATGQLEVFVGDITLRGHKWNGGGSGSGRWLVSETILKYADCTPTQKQIYLGLWAELVEGSQRDAVDSAVEEHRA